MGRDLQKLDDDVIFAKRVIKEKLCKDMDIIKYLNNKDLEDVGAEPDEYFGVNIFPFIRIPGTQDVSKSYITFMLDDMESSQFNKAMKSQFLKVVIFVHKDLNKTKFGVERHDLLAYLVKDIFHLSNSLGLQLNLKSDREGVTDTDYCTRTLQFEMITPNSPQPYKTNKYERESIVHNHDRRVKRESV